VILRLLARWVLLAVIIMAVAAIVPGIHVSGGFGTYLWLAFLLSIVNVFLGTFLRLLSFPLIIITFGLFLLVVNAAILAVTAWLSRRLAVDNFGSAVLGGFLIGFFSWLAELVLPLRRRHRESH
jgi:putative membrane protein